MVSSLPHTTICFPFLGIQHGFRLQLASLSCALLVVGFVVLLTRIPSTTVVPRSSRGGEHSVNFTCASEYRPCPSWWADRALLITMYGSKKLSVAKPSSLLGSSPLPSTHPKVPVRQRPHHPAGGHFRRSHGPGIPVSGYTCDTVVYRWDTFPHGLSLNN